ncbi:MAG: monovalent cation/H(+) antiporter subunit G [Natronospirillum sp.]|uniref:monovalent cation/H(+) antiporter subunit G n=1 Tax=Natronospirillum sp. TaxID=2812955 RepID=UPI0025DC864F|nr:monovalent cation/H(+) antiporter subunit G [Natronospirillum sp.]MCH8551803.1 monovalent cation/H(+) antiporter subunit G [Natronospirillum sp.]
MIEILVSIFLLSGASLGLLAAIGIIRLPDLLTRMHASTKSGALGTAMIMVGVMLAFMEPVVTFRAFAIIMFIMITSPVAAHVIARAGYFVGVSLWDGTVKDMLKESYDPESHYLRSGFEGMDDDGETDDMDESEDQAR